MDIFSQMMYTPTQEVLWVSEGRMVRKQLYIMPTQAELLKEKAATYSLSEGALVRMALDQYLAAPMAGEAPLNLSAWKEEQGFIVQRMALAKTCEDVRDQALEEKRAWKREDLYEC
jgi:hypothetical protein